MKLKFKKEKIIFLVIFFFIAFIALQIPIFQIVGARQKFTLFEFLYPLSAAFLGPWWGGLIVFLVKITDWLGRGTAIDLVTFIRFFPAVFAALYFASKSKFNLAIPIICMTLFWIHPVGRAAFPYGLFWLIPILVFPLKKNLALNSLGTTFIAHAIGSTAFLYSVPMTAKIWQGLIPVVFVERFVFAAGITLSYLFVRVLLKFLIRVSKKETIKSLITENLRI